jgi:predicted NUDIX family phosphoesterase
MSQIDSTPVAPAPPKRVALCYRGSFEEFFATIKEDPNARVSVEFVDRKICEPEDSGYLQVIPYGIFTTYVPDKGNVRFMAYNRPGGSNGEERLKGKTSIGFGGHVDRESDMEGLLQDLVTDVDDEGRCFYLVTANEISTLAKACLRREIQEELGIDVMELIPEVFTAATAVILRENDDELDAVGRVHMCFAYSLNLSNQDFYNVFTNCVVDDKEIIELRSIDIKANDFLMDFNLTESIKSTGVQLRAEEVNMEGWSVLVVLFYLTSIIHTVKEKLTLTDMFEMITHKETMQAKFDQEQAEAALAVSQATDQAAEPLQTVDQTTTGAEPYAN